MVEVIFSDDGASTGHQLRAVKLWLICAR